MRASYIPLLLALSWSWISNWTEVGAGSDAPITHEVASDVIGILSNGCDSLDNTENLDIFLGELESLLWELEAKINDSAFDEEELRELSHKFKSCAKSLQVKRQIFLDMNKKGFNNDFLQASRRVNYLLIKLTNLKNKINRDLKAWPRISPFFKLLWPILIISILIYSLSSFFMTFRNNTTE